MTRDFLFMAGEFAVTMPLVFQFDNWQHTSTNSKLVLENGIVTREGKNDNLKGIILYADQQNKSLEKSNLEFLNAGHVFCWPNPEVLLNMLYRQETLRKCCEAGFVSHRVEFVNSPAEIVFEFPYVLKVGFAHCGQDKYLVKSSDDVPEFAEQSTVEPYFEGDSVRVLFIDEKYFVYKINNDDSWIKNSSGANIEIINDDFKYSHLISHAANVKKLFNLEIAGVDYIVNKNQFHFLEINQFPGVNSSDEIAATAKEFLANKMKLIESLANE